MGDLFVAADQFGVERLKRLCEKKILVSINIDSAATILQAANVHIAHGLRQNCMDFILRNFDAVSKTAAFEEMGRSNVELVFEILKRRASCVVVPSEQAGQRAGCESSVAANADASARK